jgi:hypothetical protein
MNTKQLNTAAVLWHRAFPGYVNPKYKPNKEHLRDWFDRSEDKTAMDWAEWPEGLQLRAYLSDFFVKRGKLCAIIQLRA